MGKFEKLYETLVIKKLSDDDKKDLEEIYEEVKIGRISQAGKKIYKLYKKTQNNTLKDKLGWMSEILKTGSRSGDIERVKDKIEKILNSNS